MNPIFDLVSTIIAKSKALVLVAESEQWDKFNEIEAERQPLIQSLNLEGLALSASDNVRLHTLMSELIKLNDQLESLCVKQRSNAAGELQKIRKGHKVNKAYSQ